MEPTLHVIRAVPYSSERPGGPIALELIESSVVRSGVAYWKLAAGQRKFPARANIAPRDMHELLRHVILLRVIGGGSDYEFRIVGDAHVIAHGFSTHGKNLSEMDEYAPGYGAVLKELYDYPVRTGRPLALRGWLSKGADASEFVYSESVFLPLGPADHEVDHVLNFSVYVPHPATTVVAARA